MALDLPNRRLLVTNFHGTAQERDLSEPANCAGFGRIRHFRRSARDRWVPNPLPIDPANRALGLAPTDMIRAQVFQSAVCNWRCWYCFVDFKLLAANLNHAAWLSATQLIELYLAESNRPPMLDLSGGQPDLTPEWIPWMMTELRVRGLEDEVYVWSDDNLSNDYFWRHVSSEDRELVASSRHYGRVCCFKGFHAESFSFNTRATPDLFARQFELIARLIDFGLDVYAYATFPTPSDDHLRENVRSFVDRLQAVNETLPLRTVPLEIAVFTPVHGRMNPLTTKAMQNQYAALEVWQEELERRYSRTERELSIVDVPLRRRGRTP